MLVYGNEKDMEDVIRVLKGINDLVEENPFTQAIRYVIDTWAQKYPDSLPIDELKRYWRFRIDLDKVIAYLESEEILSRSRHPVTHKVVLSPSTILSSLLQKYPSSRELFTSIVKAITGLAVVRYLVDPDNPRLRYIYATLQSLGACIERGTREPVYEVRGYRCKLCGKTFSTSIEGRTHVQNEHPDEIEDEESFEKNIEPVLGDKIGELCRYEYFIEKADVYGVRDIGKYMRYLLSKGAIVPPKGDEIIVHRGEEKHIVVDDSWIRVRERMRELEKKLIRTR